MNAYLQESTNESESLKEKVVGPGECLRKQRESMGLTHADVAGHLNLRISIIEAIEEDNYKNIPKLVFARGYLRSYAKLLNIPGNEIIEIFNKLECPENPSELPAAPLRAGQKKPIKKEHSFVPWIALIILLILFVGVGFWRHINAFLTHSPSSSVSLSSKIVTNQSQPLSSSNTSESQPQKAATVKNKNDSTTPSEASAVALPDLDHFKQEN